MGEHGFKFTDCDSDVYSKKEPDYYDRGPHNAFTRIISMQTATHFLIRKLNMILLHLLSTQTSNLNLHGGGQFLKEKMEIQGDEDKNWVLCGDLQDKINLKRKTP